MALRDLWHGYREQKIKRYLKANHAYVINALRNDPALATAAVQSAMLLDAAKGAPQRETAQYPVLSSLGYGGTSPLQRGLPKSSPWNLRAFGEKPPARRAINAIVHPILDMPFKISLRPPVDTERYAATVEPTAEQHARIVAATEMFERPNNDQSGREALAMALEDLVCLGAAAYEVQDNTSDNRPLFLWPTDAQSIRINAQWRAGSTAYRYAQGKGYFYSAVGTTDDTQLTDEEMLYVKLNARSSTPFGLGYLEIAFDTINAFLGAFAFAERRASNMTPPFALFLGENVTVEQVRIWQHYWENEVEGYGKTPIIGGGRAPSVLNMMGQGEDALWLEWQEFLIRMIAMAFGLSPMRLGLERDVNRSTSETQTQSDWATIAPVANTMRDAYMQWILWKRLGWTDLQFEWAVKTADELRQADILAEQYTMNAITVDEIRETYERPPLPDGLGQMTKTAYETAIKVAAMPSPQPADGEDEEGDEDAPASASARQQAHALLTPFAAEHDQLSPQEAAFVRALLREQRQARHGAVAAT